MDLVDEVKQWAAYASDVIPHPAAETLVAWFIGINDTGDTQHNTTLDFPAFWEAEMQALFGAVVRFPLPLPHSRSLTPPFLPLPQQTAYAHSLRGTYLFINVPPLDRSPGALAQDAAARATKKRDVVRRWGMDDLCGPRSACGNDDDGAGNVEASAKEVVGMRGCARAQYATGERARNRHGARGEGARTLTRGYSTMEWVWRGGESLALPAGGR